MTMTILSIAGKPGLYKLVSRGKINLIVESIDETHKRIPAFATDRVTSLADIAIYTEGEDIPLVNVLASIRNKEEGKEASINAKKSSSAELRKYFAEILPEFDKDRVRDNDIRKLISWYNILIKNGITNFEEELTPNNEEETREQEEKQ
ncbi:MAG: DUF5606 domain-containing protein [Prevotella sp.]|nr:DUF5606 domain-containing protein [Prevotella sp.]